MLHLNFWSRLSLVLPLTQGCTASPSSSHESIGGNDDDSSGNSEELSAGSTPSETSAAEENETGSNNTGGDEAEEVPCIYVGRLRGQVLTTTGEAPEVKTVTICGSACLPGKLEDDGSFDIELDHCFVPGEVGYVQPNFIYHGNHIYADVTVDIVPDQEMDVQEHVFAKTIYTVDLTGSPEAEFDEESDFALSTPEGLLLEVNAEALELPIGAHSVSATRVDPAFYPLADLEGELLDLWYFGPDNAVFSEPAKLTLPNDTELEAGTRVNLVAVGNLGISEAFETGTTGAIGTATVSDDRTQIISDPTSGDTGLKTLGWVGVQLVAK